MKAIPGKLGRNQIYVIEAARYSYVIMKRAHDSLRRKLRLAERRDIRQSDVIHITASAWQWVDMAFRFGRTIGQVRGLKQNYPDFKVAREATQKVEEARNYIQHIYTELPRVDEQSYPMLGAVTWPSRDLLSSFTIALGTLPPGTKFHTASFHTKSRKYVDGIILNVAKEHLNISQLQRDFGKGNAYLGKWLKCIDGISDRDVVPNILKAGSLDAFCRMKNIKEYIRVLFTVNEGIK